jgi:hypothetical protein
MHPPTGLDPANTPRLHAGMEGLELWYYLLEVPEQATCFWFRHVLFQPRQGLGWAELQVFRWGADGFSQAQERFPLTSVRSSERFFFVQTGKSWLRQSGAWGEIQGTVQWELDWQPNPQMRPLLPSFLHQGKTQGFLAQPWLSATGTLVWGDAIYQLDQAPALQGHLMSRALPARWLWGAATAEEIQVETLCVWRYPHLPPVIGCTVHYEGDDWITAGWEPLWRNRSQIQAQTWSLQAQQGDRRVELEWRIPGLDEALPLNWDAETHYQVHMAAQCILELRLFQRQSGTWKLKAHLELSGWVESLQRKV